MCRRYYRTADKQQLAEAFRADATGDSLSYAPGFNIAPTTIQPVIRQARETSLREIVPMRWGLVGFGSAGIDPKRSTFNARAEGLQQSSLWKRPLPSCLPALLPQRKTLRSILPTVQAFRSSPALPATNSLRSSRHRHSSKTRVTVLV